MLYGVSIPCGQIMLRVRTNGIQMLNLLTAFPRTEEACIACLASARRRYAVPMSLLLFIRSRHLRA